MTEVRSPMTSMGLRFSSCCRLVKQDRIARPQATWGHLVVDIGRSA
jgi:hypothetical protein